MGLFRVVGYAANRNVNRDRVGVQAFAKAVYFSWKN